MDKLITFAQFSKDVEAYLVSKLPDLSVHIRMEIVEYVTHKTSNIVSDAVNERDRMWQLASRREIMDKLKSQRDSCDGVENPTDEPSNEPCDEPRTDDENT